MRPEIMQTYMRGSDYPDWQTGSGGPNIWVTYKEHANGNMY